MRRLVIIAACLWVVASFGQAPDEPRLDPDVLPAQFVDPYRQPGYVPGRIMSNPAPSTMVMPTPVMSDTMSPAVRLQIRTPAYSQPNQPIKSRIVITNATNATAYKVKVRHPVPTGMTGIYEPNPVAAAANPNEKTWDFAELGPGETKEILTTYTPANGASDFELKAYVSCEHGQKVRTLIESGKLTIRTLAPERAYGNEPFDVRVELTNTSKVAISNLRLTETITQGFELLTDDQAEGNQPQQRVWKLEQLGPMQTRIVSFRVKPVGGEDCTCSSSVSYDKGGIATSDAKTKILVPKVEVKLNGPLTASEGNVAEYTATISNIGNVTLDRVNISVLLPTACKVKSKPEGATIRDREILFTLGNRNDGPLVVNGKQQIKFSLIPTRSGTQVVEVAVDAGRRATHADTIRTEVSGSAQLKARFEFEPGQLIVNQSGSVTCTVSNIGGDTDKDVSLVVELPEEVTVSRLPQNAKLDGRRLVFDPINLMAQQEVKYTIPYDARRAGSALFMFRLKSASQREPITQDKSIRISP
jgi:Domain of unknown function DUF11